MISLIRKNPTGYLVPHNAVPITEQIKDTFLMFLNVDVLKII